MRPRRWFLCLFVTLWIVSGISVFAQQPPQAGGYPRASAAPPILKVEWVPAPNQKTVPPGQADTPAGDAARMITQGNIADPNVQLQKYGPGASKVLTSGTAGSTEQPYSVWAGTHEGPFAITFREKNYYLDMSSSVARIRWVVKTSGFHVVRPVVKLADGTLLVGDHTDASEAMLAQSEFSLAGVRWLKLDPNRVVTLPNAPDEATIGRIASHEIWVAHADLSKVDEIGFADLMPGSGHGFGGYIHVGQIEVYGKAVPRNQQVSSR